MAAGIVPPPTGVSVPWTVPIIASGVLATNSWLGGLLQVVDFVIVAFIWYPFLKILDKPTRLGCLVTTAFTTSKKGRDKSHLGLRN